MVLFSITHRLFTNSKPIQKTFKRWKLKVGVIGVPFARGQIKSGVEKAPDALRQAGLINVLKQMGHDVKDYGDVCYNEKETSVVGEIHANMSWLPQVAVCSEKVSLKAEEIIIKDRILLTLGGDHSVALGSVDGHIKAKLGNVSVLWVDAHPDLNTADTSPSGNLHGMTAALLVKEMSHFWPYLPGLDWQKPTISINKLAYIGLRSIDSDERVIMEKFGVAAYGMSDIEKLGIHDVTEEAIWKINPVGDSSIHLSFDIDALDTLEAPSTGTPVRGGLTLREALILVETVQKTGRLTAIDLVEINPHIGTDHQVKLTLEAALHIIKAAFAHSRSGKMRHKVYPAASYKPLEDFIEQNKFEVASLPGLKKKKKPRNKTQILSEDPLLGGSKSKQQLATIEKGLEINNSENLNKQTLKNKLVKTQLNSVKDEKEENKKNQKQNTKDKAFAKDTLNKGESLDIRLPDK